MHPKVLEHSIYFCNIFHGSNFILFTDNMAETIMKLASDEEEAMIIVGDFNIDPKRDSSKFQYLSQG